MTIASRIQAAMTEAGLNQNQLATRTGLTPGYLSNLFKRNPRRIDSDIAAKIAAALGVTSSWILTGSAPRTSNDTSPMAPPVSGEHTTDEAADQLIAAAFDPTCHEYVDAIPVRASLKVAAPLLRADMDPVDYVRRMLDTVARRRRDGKTVTPDTLHGATFSDLSAEAREYRAQVEVMKAHLDEARAWMLAHGFNEDDARLPPAPSEPPVVPSRPARKRGV
jgi:transcriptional regulator with XRE-family HTH domain